jgi:hypothetical protein
MPVSDPQRSAEGDHALPFWHRDSRFQIEQHWLRHSRALGWISTPSGVDRAVNDRGARCGPISFAAITGRDAEAALGFFPNIADRAWTTRTDMQRALREGGHQYDRRADVWPSHGLCMVQFTGPWTERGFAQAALQHTHWIAVLGEYVFDINWDGWLPRECWEDVVLAELLVFRPGATGWRVLTGFELSPPLTCIVHSDVHC